MQKQKIKFKLNQETELPESLINAVPNSGRADDSVEDILKTYDIECDPEELKKFLKSYGAWDSKELQDHNANLARLIWLSTLDCQEQKTTYFYMGE